MPPAATATAKLLSPANWPAARRRSCTSTRLQPANGACSTLQMLVLPGGFSYGDDLGAGKLWAVALRYRLGDEMQAFVDSGRPVIGICNGFQVLVKAGLLPGSDRVEGKEWRVEGTGTRQQATLTRNDSARFECRWVTLHPQAGSPCVFTQGLDEPILCPVAHGEGKFVARDEETLARDRAAGAGGAALCQAARSDGALSRG